MSNKIKCPRCKDWVTSFETPRFAGRRVVGKRFTCYLCGGTRRISPELDAAYNLIYDKNKDLPTPNWRAIKELYRNTNLLSPDAREAIRPYLEPREKVMAAITNEGIVLDLEDFQ